MAYYANPPPAYSAYPASAQKYSILDHYPRRQSQVASHALSPAQFIPGQALTRDQMQYVKSYNRAVAIYNASARKNFLTCSQKGCTNVLNTFGNLVIELHLHEIASNGTCCAVCTNWFESWSAKDRHMCPGPGGHCPEEDPDAAPVAPPIAQMSAADPYFFHHSMHRQQYAVVAARRAMETRRSVRPGSQLPCDFHGCAAHLPTEAALMEHIFAHFQHACGGLCASCKTWIPDSKSREAHKCGHSHLNRGIVSELISRSNNLDSIYTRRNLTSPGIFGPPVNPTIRTLPVQFNVRLSKLDVPSQHDDTGICGGHVNLGILARLVLDSDDFLT